MLNNILQRVKQCFMLSCVSFDFFFNCFFVALLIVKKIQGLKTSSLEACDFKMARGAKSQDAWSQMARD